MIKENLRVINYSSAYFDNLKSSYEKSFKKLFISKSLYEERFSYEKNFSSYLLIANHNNSVVGHIGFRIHNLNIKYHYKIAFRFSTFIIPSERGGNTYLKFMDFVKNEIKVKFNVLFIYAWPNKINLLSCLKDADYINLNPIITWQHHLGNNENHYDQENSFKYKSIDLNNFEYQIKRKKFGLTFDSTEIYKSIFLTRDDKEYKIISINKNKYAILGISFIDNKELISILINNDLEISFILNVLNMHHKNKKSFIQCWCFYKDKNLLRQLLKLNFKEDGPLFYNGVYELGNVKFPHNRYFPYMYNHDAF